MDGGTGTFAAVMNFCSWSLLLEEKDEGNTGQRCGARGYQQVRQLFRLLLLSGHGSSQQGFHLKIYQQNQHGKNINRRKIIFHNFS